MKKEKSILVIEDDIDLCNSIMSALQRSGYRPFGASELREATLKLKNQTFACILVDMRLGADSGEELIEFIRERKDAQNIDTPILVISGHLDKSLVAKIAKKIQGALVKPFDMNALLESVEKHAG